MQKNKKSSLLIYTSIWLAALSIGLYFRLFPLINYIPEDSSEKATVFVMAQLRAKITQQVNSKHPDMPNIKKKILIQKLFDKSLHNQKNKARETIEKVSRKITQSSGPSRKFPYLLASDSFYYYALTQNIAETGAISDTIKGSKFLNKMMLAPLGHWEPLNLHPYVGYYIYKVLKIFNTGTKLMYAVSFTPLIITSLAVIPFLLICYMLGCRPVFSFTGAIFFLLAPVFIKRSTFGWYDNDPYNTLFPLTILACAFYAFRDKGDFKQTITASGLFCFLIMLYAFFWQGWVFMFTIILVSAIIIFIYNFTTLKGVQKKKKLRTLSISLGIICLGSIAAITAVFGIKEFFILFSEGWHALKNFLVPQLSPWPDIYISVGELKKIPLSKIINLTGGYFFFSFAALGYIFTIIKIILSTDESKRRTAIHNIIILSVFLSGSFLIALRAQRFAILCLIPLAIAFPLGLQYTADIIERRLTKTLSQKKHTKSTIRTVLSFIVIFSIIIPINSINASIKSLLNPIFNATWEKTLIRIRDNTPEESIINTWWPPGHFIKAIAKRRVTFDGATINSPQAYWISNIFLSQTEEEALGIIRMLNNSGNQAAEYLQGLGINLSTSVLLLKKITTMDKISAKHFLLKLLKTGQNADRLLAMTHASPPSSYCLIYKEFVDNNLQLTFFGNWDFKKIEQINNSREMMKKVPNTNSEDYIKFLWKLAGGRYKYSELLNQLGSSDKNILLFQHNLNVSLENMACKIASEKYGKGIPLSIFYLKDGRLIEKKLAGANLSYSVILFKNSGRYNCILLDPRLARSLLIRLYFYEGTGLEYFQRFIKESDLTKRTQIYVYKIDWDKFKKAEKQKNRR